MISPKETPRPEARGQSLLIRGVSKEMLFVVAASLSETRGESFMAVSNNLSTRVRWFFSLKSRVQDVGVSLYFRPCCPKLKKSQEISGNCFEWQGNKPRKLNSAHGLGQVADFGRSFGKLRCSASFFVFHAGVVTISTVGTGTGTGTLSRNESWVRNPIQPTPALTKFNFYRIWMVEAVYFWNVMFHAPASNPASSAHSFGQFAAECRR